MSFRDNVSQYGLNEQIIAKIFVEEVRTYRNELIHLEAAWKAHPVWSSVSNRDDDLAVFQSLWEGIAIEGLGVPRDWDFVERNFAQFDQEMQGNIRDLLRNQKNLPESLRLAAQARLEMAGANSNAMSIPVAIDIIARARAEAARMVRENSDFHDLAKLASLAASFGQIVGSSDRASTMTPPIFAEPNQLNAPLDEEQQNFAAMTPTEFADAFIKTLFGGLEKRTGGKRKRHIVQESTLRDVRWVALLLEKSLPVGTPFAQVNAKNV
ncbi:MAG: hypothetical protein WA918_10755, partial [Erythrobacter sp.]